jgi:stage III sporulation protein AB
MLQWIGATLILFAGTAYGFAQASWYARRPKELRQLSSALLTLESEIVYGLSPLPTALSRVASTVPRPVSLLFAEASERMGDKAQERTAGDCWSDAVNRIWPSTSLREAEKSSLLALSPTLGLTDRDDQAKHIRLAVSQLRSEEETAREEQLRYGTMWKSLGALSAALVVILMY